MCVLNVFIKDLKGHYPLQKAHGGSEWNRTISIVLSK